jgi:hypothetical protein
LEDIPEDKNFLEGTLTPFGNTLEDAPTGHPWRTLWRTIGGYPFGNSGGPLGEHPLRTTWSNSYRMVSEGGLSKVSSEIVLRGFSP